MAVSDAAGESRALADQSPNKSTILPVQDIKSKRNVPRGSGKARQYATAIIVNIAALTTGMVMGWSSPSLPLLESKDSPIGLHLTKPQTSWLASVNLLSGIPGTLLFAVVADRWGRRTAGLAVAVPFALSWILITATDSLELLFLARILAGLASGGTMVVCPLYVGETAADEHRGALGTFLAVGINAGITVTFLIGAFVGYRALPLICLILPCMFFLGLLKLPETPAYHLKRGKESRARRSLEWYRGGASRAVDTEMETLKLSARQDDSESSVSFKDLFCHQGTRKALITSVCLMLNQQFCGVLAILNYTETIFREAGSDLTPATSSIIVAALMAVMTYLSSFLIDSMGRKTLLIVSNILMSVCISTVGACFWAQSKGYDITAISWLPLVCMSAYVMAFAVGLGPVPLVILAETYSTKVRSLATSIAISSQMIAAFLSTKSFASIAEWLGIHGCLWLFGGFCLLGVVFVGFYVIETKGKTLEQILREYNGKSLLPSDTPEKQAPLVNDYDKSGL